MPSDRESSTARAFAEAQDLLVSAGFHTNTTLDDLRKWFLADTAYADIGLEQVLGSRLLLVHEIVEIYEVKKMGLALEKDVIVKHSDPVYEAHLKAAEVEIELSIELKDYDHIKYRLDQIRSWYQDPLLPKRLRYRCSNLYKKARSAVQDCQGHPEAEV